MNAIKELCYTLIDAWVDADLPTRLRAWWWTVTHPELLDAPAPAGE